MSNEVATTTQETTTTAVAKIDNGKQALYNPAAFDQIWRAAQMFSRSDLVPTAYKGKTENCFIAIEMADRMGISPFAMLQSLVIIQGKPSMEAKLIIALVNDSGIFADPLEYEIVGSDPYPPAGTKPELHDYKVRAFATMKKSGKLCQGPWITYKMVVGEGWLSKGGSKWQTMPSIMFMYRAASFFAKVYCPNITMGMQTREEMEDLKPIDITPAKQIAPALVEALQIAKDTAPPLAPVTTVGNAPPTLAAVTEVIDVEGEIVDTTTGEVVKERRPRRTKAEMATDALALALAQAGAEPVIDHATPAPSDDDGFPDPPGTNKTAEVMRDNMPPSPQEPPPHPGDEQQPSEPAAEAEGSEDLF
jgi:hypothetical protein